MKNLKEVREMRNKRIYGLIDIVDGEIILTLFDSNEKEILKFDNIKQLECYLNHINKLLEDKEIKKFLRFAISKKIKKLLDKEFNNILELELTSW
jgi:hypothetical protein